MNPARTLSPVARVVALAGAMIAAAIGAVAWAPGGSASLRGDHWWTAVLITCGFALAEQAVFRVEHRREAIAVSMSEVPTLFALLFLDVRVAIAARTVGWLMSVGLQRRPPPYKLLFNGALFAFETAIAAFALRTVLGHTDGSITAQLATGVVAVAAATVVGSVAVRAAIAQFEGRFVASAAGELASTAWVYALSSSIAGLIVSPALVTPWLTPFAFIPLGVFWLFVRRQAEVSQRLRDVQALHGFSGSIAGAAGLDDIASVAVRETAELLRAGSCTVFVVDGSQLVPIASTGARIALPTGFGIDALTADRSGDVCVAALVTDEGIIGALAVAHREGAAGSFSDADADRLRTLADQLSAPVARGLLHRQLEHEARHDQLTGLANRGAFERALAARLTPGADTATPEHVVDVGDTGEHDGAASAGERIDFVIMLDLDRFKEVNDTLGHHAGDELLVEVGRRLRATVDDGDLLARFAGDEFGVAGSRADLDEIDLFARTCVATVSAPCRITGLELVVTASAGVAVRPGDGDVHLDAASLLRRADIAMYHAKQHHLGHEVYRAEIDRRTPARLSMLADLRAAIDHGDIELHFQPKLDLVTNVVCGAEALARWNHPTRGHVPPTDFIGVAEQSGLIRPLTDQIIEGTVRAIAALDHRGYHLALAMNISAHDLIDELLCDRIEHRLERYAVAPDRLTLEITEGTLLHDSPRTRATIARLHDLGIRLSVDDFGTGYSSLSYLRQLPVAEIKIDRSFITDLVVDTQDETIVRSTIDLGHNLGLQVVAEGVETNEVVDRLRTLGCDIAQGYGICRPVSLDQLLRWLATTSYTAPRHDSPVRVRP